MREVENKSKKEVDIEIGQRNECVLLVRRKLNVE